MGSYLPDDFPAMCRRAGLKVVEVEGWRSRSTRLTSDRPVGVLNHHTGASAKGWSLAKELAYAKWMFLTGRSDLSAPLCQIALGRSGTVYIGAAGRANHAGVAKASGSVAGGDGNSLYIGIEWMLSGTEAIPATMMMAAIRLNAVLTEKVTKNSVETISCHYQTSVTGKWDIGDPNGIPYRGTTVLDTKKFRLAVMAEKDRLYSSPVEIVDVTRPSMRVKVAHFSGEFSDKPYMWEHDAERIFTRGYAWLTGTEVGENWNFAVVKRVAKSHGYVIRRFRANWVAVKKNIIKRGTLKWGTELVVKSSEQYGHQPDRGLLWATFEHRTPGVGIVSVIGSHYPTKGQPDGKGIYRRNLPLTKRMAAALRRKTNELGKGPALVFYGADQNIRDRVNDTFFGGPLISCWDELKKWPDTGHGNIDVIARFKKDARVTCVRARAFTDRDLFLYSDHYLIEAVYRIAY